LHLTAKYPATTAEERAQPVSGFLLENVKFPDSTKRPSMIRKVVAILFLLGSFLIAQENSIQPKSIDLEGKDGTLLKVTYYASAKAGPAKATAAANASVANMVLFDIGFLPVDVKRRCQLQNNGLPDLFPKWR